MLYQGTTTTHLIRNDFQLFKSILPQPLLIAPIALRHNSMPHGIIQLQQSTKLQGLLTDAEVLRGRNRQTGDRGNGAQGSKGSKTEEKKHDENKEAEEERSIISWRRLKKESPAKMSKQQLPQHILSWSLLQKCSS